MAELQQSYSHLAGEYDRKRFRGAQGRFLFETDKAIIRDYVREAGIRRLLDMPTGTGRVLDYLGDLDVRIVGLDYTPDMLAHARALVRPGRHHLMRGDGARLPFRDGEFDGITSLRFFHLFPEADRPAFAREFLRVVKPGGHLIVSFTNGWYAGGLNWIKRFLGQQVVHFENPGEVRRLFRGCRILRRSGNFLPKQGLIDPVPGLGPLVRAANRHTPLNLICWERVYLLQKPGAGAPDA